MNTGISRDNLSRLGLVASSWLPQIYYRQKKLQAIPEFRISDQTCFVLFVLFHANLVRPELNGLFREEDYPSVDKLRSKFALKLELLPIPSGEDFRVILSDEEQARIAREINDHVRQSLEKGTEDLWNRLKSVVSHLVKRLREPDARYHASLVTNLLDLVELMPRLNVNQDEDLDRFASELRNQLGTLTARDLKKNDILRVATAQQLPPQLSGRSC